MVSTNMKLFLKIKKNKKSKHQSVMKYEIFRGGDGYGF